jgi:hypothetical protein
MVHVKVKYVPTKLVLDSGSTDHVFTRELATRAHLSSPARFDGGVFVAGARCVDLDVFIDGATEGERITLGFGVMCP